VKFGLISVENFTCKLSDRSLEKKEDVFCIINMVCNDNMSDRDLLQKFN